MLRHYAKGKFSLTESHPERKKERKRKESIALTMNSLISLSSQGSGLACFAYIIEESSSKSLRATAPVVCGTHGSRGTDLGSAKSCEALPD